MKLRCMIGLICGLMLCGCLVTFGTTAEVSVRLGGIPVTDANAADVLGDGTVRYTPPDGEEPAILWLCGAKTTALSVSGAPLTLETTGENRIEGGMEVGCPLTVCGAGSLTVTGGVSLAAGGEVILPTGMRVYADNMENGWNAVLIENPDADVYRSPYIRFETGSCTVRYLPDGTCGGDPTERKKYDGVPLILPDALFRRTGYTQSGWRCADGSAEYALGETVDDPSNLTFYPVWSVNLYTVTFRPENGEQDLIQTVAYGAPLTVPATPTRIGFRFCGWDRTVPETVPAKDLTFAALWEICDHGGNLTERSCVGKTVCSVCGETLEQLPHCPSEDDGDCTTPVFCRVCGAVVRIGEAGHRFGPWLTDPDGGRHRVCRNEGCEYRETERCPQTDEPGTEADEEPDRMPPTLRTGSGDAATSGRTEAGEGTTPPGKKADAQDPSVPQSDGCNSSLSGSAAFSVISACAFVQLRRRKRKKKT